MRAVWDYRRTLLYASVALSVFIFLGVWAYKNEWLIHRGNAPQAVEHPSVVHQQLVPTNLEQVRAWFGPWHLTDPSHPGSDSLVLIRGDGGMEMSSWTVKTDSSWRPTDVPQIDQFSTFSTHVEFTLGGLTVYSVKYGQPFVLEQAPDRVFAIISRGGRGRIVSTTPRIVKQAGHKA